MKDGNIQKIGILGGGVAGVNLARLLDQKNEITILEASKNPGGLARSYEYEEFYYDVGPHIIFSKKKEILDYMISICPDQLAQYQRSNQIWYKDRLVKYPFENFLGLLPDEDRDFCVKEFLQNPYEGDYQPQNMLQFFLKTFGAGITNTYLRAYNEKIWKFDPSFLDVQMVERIPKPPKEDILSGAEGKYKEGYLHQVNFYYPKQGGIGTFFNAMKEKLGPNSRFLAGHRVVDVKKEGDRWKVKCENGEFFEFDQLINCLPLHDLFAILKIPPPEEVQHSIGRLLYNSMHFGLAVYRKDQAGNHFAFNIPQKEILFHRLSKVNFIGENNPADKSAFLFEVTFREGSYIGSLGEEQIKEQVVQGIEQMNFARREDMVGLDLKTVKYAYVIYDLNHRKNTDRVLNYLKSLGIRCCGRFAEHEYVNMDQVIESAMKLSSELNTQNS